MTPSLATNPVSKAVPALKEEGKVAAGPVSKSVPALKSEAPIGPASKSVPALKEEPKAPAAINPISKAVPSLKSESPVGPASKSVPSLKSDAGPTSKAVPALKEEAKVISRAVIALKEEPKPELKVEAKTEPTPEPKPEPKLEPKIEAKKEEAPKKPRPWKKTSIKLRKKLKELKTFARGPVVAIPTPTARNVPTSSPSQREILLGINEKMSAVANLIRTGDLQVVDEPDGGLRSMVEPKKVSNANEYGSMVSNSSLKAVSRTDMPKPPPPPVKKGGDFEDFGAPAIDLPKPQAAPIRINTLELEIMEDPTELSGSYASHVAPSILNPITPGKSEPVVEPVVVSKPLQDSGEIALRKSASKSKTFIMAAFALSAAAVAGYSLFSTKGADVTSQNVAAVTPTITAEPTLVTVSNDDRISQAAALAIQGKWDEAASLAEAAQDPNLAKRYRIEGEVSLNLRECRKSRDEKKLEDAMAACHLVEIVEGSQSAQIAGPEIEELKKAYKSRHVPLTKKEISRNTAVSLSDAKQEIELLSLYIGKESPEVSTLERLYQEQLKKLPGKEKVIAQKETPGLTKNPISSADQKTTEQKAAASLVPLNPTPTAAVSEAGGKIYQVNGAYISLGGFSNRTKDAGLSSKYQAAISRSVASSGKVLAPPSGKDPLTIIGAVTKADTKVSGGNTVITISVSLQITRNSAILAFLSKDASAEFSGSITPAEEKSGKEEVIKALADGIFNDLKKSLPKFK